jgi:putative transposase
MVLPREGTKISQLLKTIKLSVGKLASNWVKENAPEFLPNMTDTQPDGMETIRFWQRGGGYDRNICSVDELYEKINYMHKNPVRRGLVNHPGDWYWSSYRAFEERINEPIDIDWESLPPMQTEIKHA